MELREVMTETVVTAGAQTAVRRVAELMRERNVGSIVLVDEAGTAVGIVTDRDLTVSVLADGHPVEQPAEGHASVPLVTGAPAMTLEEATELMARHGIRRLPVVEDGRLTGIVTLSDIAARTGDLEGAQRLTAEITRAALPGFYFHDRGG
jgi:signal-transduction protein with cAMP-binding, CBS, and nucleotidyltransferase domain